MTTWGPLAEPIHGLVPDGMPPWKDNAYLAFWDPDAAVYGVFHASTSPNGEGRRTRLSVQAAGRMVEVIEEPAIGTFDTESISFDLHSAYTVDADALQASFTAAPHHPLADYNTGVLPELVAGQPLQHYQRGARVHGSVTIGGETVEFDGHGLRDRTWGYRDESLMYVEYIGGMAIFDTYTVACMTFMGPGGQ